MLLLKSPRLLSTAAAEGTDVGTGIVSGASVLMGSAEVVADLVGAADVELFLGVC